MAAIIAWFSMAWLSVLGGTHGCRIFQTYQNCTATGLYTTKTMSDYIDKPKLNATFMAAGSWSLLRVCCLTLLAPWWPSSHWWWEGGAGRDEDGFISALCRTKLQGRLSSSGSSLPNSHCILFFLFILLTTGCCIQSCFGEWRTSCSFALLVAWQQALCKMPLSCCLFGLFCLPSCLICASFSLYLVVFVRHGLKVESSDFLFSSCQGLILGAVGKKKLVGSSHTTVSVFLLRSLGRFTEFLDSFTSNSNSLWSTKCTSRLKGC